MTSNMEDLVVLVMVAIDSAPNVIDGKIKLANPLFIPPDGSHPKYTENNRINIRPSQKDGIDTPNNAIIIPTLSNIEYCFVADIIPIGIETTTAKNMAPTAKITVLGNLEKISKETSFPDT